MAGCVIRWTEVPPLPDILYSCSQSALLDDHLMVCGAESTHIFDPSTLTWSEGAPMGSPLVYRGQSTLPDGRVLLSGGAPSMRDSAVAEAEVYDPATNTWAAVTPMWVARCGHAQATLADGRVLVCGGREDADYQYDEGFRTAEIYDPESNTWAAVAEMATARDHPSASGLQDGRVLVCGGRGVSIPDALGLVELYNPFTNTWAEAAPMAARRKNHGQCTLSDGTVLVCGGKGGTFQYGNIELDTAEIYNPATNGWVAAWPMRWKRGFSVGLAALSDGRALTCGARTTEIYGPVPDVWTHATPMRARRAGHAQCTLADGRVLVSGGVDDDSGGTLQTTEIYDPKTNEWAIGAPMHTARQFHTQSLLGDGRVLACGGHGDELGVGFRSTELYDPATDAWSPGPPLFFDRLWHSQCTLADGRVLVCGGWLHEESVKSTEIYDPATGRWNVAAPMQYPRASHGQSLLATGAVLVSGNLSRSRDEAVEIYDPATNTWSIGADMLEERKEGRSQSTLADGRVLACGGYGERRFEEVGSSDTAEIYDPDRQVWVDVPQMREKRTSHSQSTLLDGRVLVCGGLGPQRTSLNTTEIFDEAFGQHFWSVQRHRQFKPEAQRWVVTVLACGHRTSHADNDACRLPCLPVEMWFKILEMVRQLEMLGS